MTTKTFTINGHEVLAVQVPKGADDIDLDIDPKEDWYCLSYVRKIEDEESGFYGEWEGYDVAIPPGNWQLIVNKPCSEWSKAEAAALLLKDGWYPLFDTPNTQTNNPIKSLHSLLTAKKLTPAETVLLRKKV
jgi:hypothetical protein